MSNLLDAVIVEQIAQEIFGQAVLYNEEFTDSGARIIQIAVGRKGNPGYDPNNVVDAQRRTAPPYVNDIRTFRFRPTVSSDEVREAFKKIVATLPENREILYDQIPAFGTIPKKRPPAERVMPHPVQDKFAPLGPGAVAGIPGASVKPMQTMEGVPVPRPESSTGEETAKTFPEQIENRFKSIEDSIAGMATNIETVVSAVASIAKKVEGKAKSGKPKK